MESGKNAEESNKRQLVAEKIIKREADKCAEETKTRTKWDDQLIEVQYMITGSMIEFSDVENKELQYRISQLEAALLKVRDRHIKNPITYSIITKALNNEA